MSPEDMEVIVNYLDDCASLECPHCLEGLGSASGKTLGELLSMAKDHVEKDCRTR